jgi:hypothetical protein
MEVATSVSGEAAQVFAEFVPGRPVRSLLSTSRDVLLSPRRFFDWLPPDGPSGPPALYFLLCYLATTFVNALAALPVLAVPMIVFVTASPSEAWPFVMMMLVFFFAIVVVLPILTIAMFFVGVALQHVFVLLAAGRNQQGLRATLRVSCYSIGATVLLVWIPIVGILVVPYSWYLYTTGLRRVHGISTVRALIAVLIPTSLVLALMAVGTFYGYKTLRESLDEPTSYYFPAPEAQGDLPPGVIGAVALMDGNEDQELVRRMKSGGDDTWSPVAEGGHTVVTVANAGAEEQPGGVTGFALNEDGDKVRIDPEHLTRDHRGGTQDILYYSDTATARSRPGYYDDRISQEMIYQSFSMDSDESYTIDLEQAGDDPRFISVRTFSGEGKIQDSYVLFYVPYRATEPGTRLKMEIEPRLPLNQDRLRIDRDGDGTHEEGWMPETAMAGPGTEDGSSPVTTPRLQDDPVREEPLLVLDARDRGAPKWDAPPSGVAITYYWINDSGPRIYTKPLPVEEGDVVTYWSLDHAGNIEWRRTTDIRTR